jgi:hypothetical protein
MLFSHRFGSVETLSRARYWMNRLGFEIAPNNEDSHDVSRLSLNVDFSKAAAAMALIDSIEASDPEGWPGFTTPTRKFHANHEKKPTETNEGRPNSAQSPIHWHRRDDVASADPHASKVVEYMSSRWE